MDQVEPTPTTPAGPQTAADVGLAGTDERAFQDVEWVDMATASVVASQRAQRSVMAGERGPSAFLMDRELLVTRAAGDSVLRLPWFEDDLFVGRPVPDIREMPAHVRNLCTQHYCAGLGGKRGRFSFRSYGHGYTVDALPVREPSGAVTGVLGVAHLAARRRKQLAPDPGLTAREIEVLQCAARGMTGSEIARHLVISPGTVKTHFENIYAKWQVPDRAAAVAVGFRQGLID
jgi:DNA-binding CsgD family transcriptional regulator